MQFLCVYGLSNVRPWPCLKGFLATQDDHALYALPLICYLILEFSHKLLRSSGVFPHVPTVKVDAFFQRLNDAEDQDLATFAMLNHLAVKKTRMQKRKGKHVESILYIYYYS